MKKGNFNLGQWFGTVVESRIGDSGGTLGRKHPPCPMLCGGNAGVALLPALWRTGWAGLPPLSAATYFAIPEWTNNKSHE